MSLLAVDRDWEPGRLRDAVKPGKQGGKIMTIKKKPRNTTFLKESKTQKVMLCCNILI